MALKLIEVTTAIYGVARKFIELTRGVDKKIYRSEWPVFNWPKTTFFYTAWQDTWAISDFD